MNRRNRIFLANLTLLVATLGFYYQRSEHKAAALANLKSTGIYTYYQSPEWLENSPEWIKKRLEELYPIELTLSATESHESLHLLKGLDVRQLDLRLEYWKPEMSIFQNIHPKRLSTISSENWCNSIALNRCS